MNFVTVSISWLEIVWLSTAAFNALLVFVLFSIALLWPPKQGKWWLAAFLGSLLAWLSLNGAMAIVQMLMHADAIDLGVAAYIQATATYVQIGLFEFAMLWLFLFVLLGLWRRPGTISRENQACETVSRERESLAPPETTAVIDDEVT